MCCFFIASNRLLVLWRHIQSYLILIFLIHYKVVTHSRVMLFFLLNKKGKGKKNNAEESCIVIFLSLISPLMQYLYSVRTACLECQAFESQGRKENSALYIKSFKCFFTGFTILCIRNYVPPMGFMVSSNVFERRI